VTSNSDLGEAGNGKQIDQLYGQGNIGYLSSGFSSALRYAMDGSLLFIVKESEQMVGTSDAISLVGKDIMTSEYQDLLSMHAVTIARMLTTSHPKDAPSNNCVLPSIETTQRRGSCIPDDEDGIHNGGIEYLGANKYTLNRLGLTDLFDIGSQ
jgi:hypothetical protein